MKYCWTLIVIFHFCMYGQRVENLNFQKVLQKLLTHSVPEISIEEAFKLKQSKIVCFLDSREKREYTISHIEGARWIGYKTFQKDSLTSIPKNKKIIIYCSVGYRSEKTVKKLHKLGFTNVFNLYGGIFEWTNSGKRVVDENNQPTNKIHTYDKHWGKWIKEGNKVYH